MAKEKKAIRREKGEGSIYPIDGGKRFGAAVYYIDENGNKKRKVITKKTEEQVNKSMTEFLIQHGLLDNDSIVIDSLSLVREVVDEFIKNSLLVSLDCGEITKRTLEDDYKPALNKLVKEFGERAIGNIRTIDLTSFFKKLSFQYSQSTLDKVYMMTVRVFKRAYIKGFLEKNPTYDMDFKKPKSKIQRESVKALSQHEIDWLKNTLHKDLMLYVPIALAMDTGARIQEVLGLRWDCINFNTGEIKIDKAISISYDTEIDEKKIQAGKKKQRDRGKSRTILSSTKTEGSKRVLFVGDETLLLLREWQSFAGDTHLGRNGKQVKNTNTKFGNNDLCFGNKKNSSWTVNGYRSSVNNFLLKQDDGQSNRIAFHRIRHYVATLLSENESVTLIELMQQLGHVNPRTTMRYIDESRKLKRKTGLLISQHNYEKEKKTG